MVRKSINNWNMALVAILSIILLVNIGSSILTDASNPKTAWEVKLNVTSTAGGSDSATFGTADNATDGIDGWDKAEAPAGWYILAYFWYPNNPQDLKKLSTSYVKLTNSMTWPLRIELIDIGNNSVANVTIEWDMTDIDKWPSDSNITLETPDGDIIDMRTNSNYTYKNLSTENHDFDITCFIEKLPDDEEENGGIPGFEIGILAISLLFSITYLLIKKKR